MVEGRKRIGDIRYLRIDWWLATLGRIVEEEGKKGKRKKREIWIEGQRV